MISVFRYRSAEATPLTRRVTPTKYDLRRKGGVFLSFVVGASRSSRVTGGAFLCAHEGVTSEVGSGSLGAASSESAAGSGRLRACGC